MSANHAQPTGPLGLNAQLYDKQGIEERVYTLAGVYESENKCIHAQKVSTRKMLLRK